MEDQNQEILTLLRKAEHDLELAQRYNYQLLKKYGPNLFEYDGSIITTYQNKEERRDGRDFILKTLKYFESKDEPQHNLMCAKIKRVLDHYDRKFSKVK